MQKHNESMFYGKSPFFDRDCDRISDLLSKQCQKLVFHERTIMHTEDVLDNVYYIVEGNVNFEISGVDGQEKTVLFLWKGIIFGTTYEKNLLTSLHSVVRSVQPMTILYKMDRNLFRHFLAVSELFREFYIWSREWAIVNLALEVANLTFNSSKERLYNLLLNTSVRQAVDGWGKVELRFTHEEMGKIVGSTRTTVSRLISKLVEEGLVSVVNRDIYVKIDR